MTGFLIGFAAKLANMNPHNHLSTIAHYTMKKPGFRSETRSRAILDTPYIWVLLFCGHCLHCHSIRQEVMSICL